LISPIKIYSLVVILKQTRCRPSGT